MFMCYSFFYKWLVENKYARKVYLDSSIGIKSLVVQVQKVNGEKT